MPEHASLRELRQAAASCRACDLWRLGTQTVFGEGAGGAEIMMVGEQPGDAEDRLGHPFVGAAGHLLDRALAEAGIPRAEVYLTNAVKHFKWEPRGKKRIHKKPSALEMAICRPWLEAEIAAVRPRVLVCLGASAAQSLLGRTFRVTQERGQPQASHWAPIVMATWHPAAILRAPDEGTRHLQMAQLVGDLRQIPRWLARRRAS